MKKKWFTVALVAAFVVVAFVVVRNRKLTKQKEEPPQLSCPDFTSEYDGKEGLTSEGFSFEKQVSIGDYGPEVAYLQERLNTQYGANVAVDGKFGCETWFALQAHAGLDGSDPIDLNDLK